MYVYHLEVIAHSNNFGKLIEDNSTISEVYSNLDKAVNIGKKWLNDRLQNLYENTDYCTQQDELTLQDLLDDDMICYNFKVTEIDPVYADNFEIPKYEYECKSLNPTHTIYYYDIEGNLQYKDLEYRSTEGVLAYVITRYPRR